MRIPSNCRLTVKTSHCLFEIKTKSEEMSMNFTINFWAPADEFLAQTLPINATRHLYSQHLTILSIWILRDILFSLSWYDPQLCKKTLKGVCLLWEMTPLVIEIIDNNTAPPTRWVAAISAPASNQVVLFKCGGCGWEWGCGHLGSPAMSIFPCWLSDNQPLRH